MTSSGEMPFLADRLNRLIAEMPGENGEKYTTRTLAAWLVGHGISVTEAHLGHLRAGRRKNPSAVLVKGLAEAFGVPIDYFLADDVTRIDEQLALLLMLRHSRVKSLLFRAHGISPEGFDDILRMLGDIRAREGLDDVASRGEQLRSEGDHTRDTLDP